jgi:hypothetical protein
LFGREEQFTDEIFHFLGKTLGLGNYISNRLLSKVYFIFFTFSMISLSFSPSKGGAAVVRMYRITPADHRSHRWS